MHENSDTPTTIPGPGRDVLTEILRDGAQRLLGQAIETEVDAWIARVRCTNPIYARRAGLGMIGGHEQASTFHR